MSDYTDRKKLNNFTLEIPGNSRDPRLHMKANSIFLLHILSWESPRITEKIQLLYKDVNSNETGKDKGCSYLKERKTSASKKASLLFRRKTNMNPHGETFWDPS